MSEEGGESRLKLSLGVELTLEQALEQIAQQELVITQLQEEKEELKTANKQKAEEIDNLQRRVDEAGVDPLTGARTRKRFHDYLAGLTKPKPPEGSDERRHQRARENTRSAMMLDIDHFKLINDEYGHPRGDQVLKQFVPALRNRLRLRDGDLVFRYGGEEFVVIFQGSTASEMIKRLRQEHGDVGPLGGAAADPSGHTRFRFRAHLEFPGDEHQGRRSFSITVTASGAITDFPPGEDFETVTYERLDRGLYEAKQKGRDRILKVTAPTKRR
jgi:diguanylate cyclase (GGDEF)-like protein